MSRDPLGEAGDPAGNLYRYVGGNPINQIDWFGLACGSPLDNLAAAMAATPWLLPAIVATEILGRGPEDPLADAAVLAEIAAAGGAAADAAAGIAAAEGAAAEEAGGLGLREAESWGKPASLDRHFADHGADFGATSAGDYASQASQFLERSQAEGLPTKMDPSGTVRTYDPASNSFGSYNANGTTRTFFKPTSPTYFD